MRPRFRFKIILLTLGVVLGYGHAFAHFQRGHAHRGSCRDDHRALFDQSE